MIIEGKTGTDEKTIPLFEWSMLPAIDPNCYREIVVEQTHADVLLRRIKFSKAFVVDYSESHHDNVGYFSLHVRQLAGLDIECSDGQAQSPPTSEIADVILNRKFNAPKSSIDNQIMEGRAGKPDYFEIKEEGVRQELSKSKVGREITEYIDKNNVPVILSYEVRKTRTGDIIYGRYEHDFDLCRIYVLNTLFYEDTAKTVIHEVIHYMGYRQTKYFEFLARYMQEKHSYEGRVPLSIIREHYNIAFKSDNYSHLPLGIPNGKRKRLEKKGLIKSVRR